MSWMKIASERGEREREKNISGQKTQKHLVMLIHLHVHILISMFHSI